MSKSIRAYLLTGYINYLGGINNLHVAWIELPDSGGCVKSFTSLKGMAAKYARAWAKKNRVELI